MFKSFPDAQKDADKISKALETESFLDQIESLKQKGEDFVSILRKEQLRQ